MRKLLVSALLLLAACQKDETTVNQPAYDGKWYIHQVINKEYTIENGDTAFTRFDVVNRPGTDYFDFQIDGQGKGDAVLLWNNNSSTRPYEAVTHAFFKLDTTLFEITHLTDSSFQFNSLYFDGTSIPDRVKVTQNFFTLGR